MIATAIRNTYDELVTLLASAKSYDPQVVARRDELRHKLAEYRERAPATYSDVMRELIR